MIACQSIKLLSNLINQINKPKIFLFPFLHNEIIGRLKLWLSFIERLSVSEIDKNYGSLLTLLLAVLGSQATGLHSGDKSRRGAGITIPGNISEQERPEPPTQILDPKDKGKGIMKEEPKKKKLTLQQLRAAETVNDEEVARKVAAEWEEEEERKRLAGLERLQAKLEDYEMIAAEVQKTERENFTKEQKAKFLVESIAAQRRF
ncbi:hypothetical protein Tco_0510554 [Tanacetum coccineum]